MTLIEERLLGTRPGINKLEEGVDRGVITIGSERVTRAQFPHPKKAIELFIVTARHVDIDVIVPGNKALVAHRADEGAIGQGVAQPMCSTDTIQLA